MERKMKKENIYREGARKREEGRKEGKREESKEGRRGRQRKKYLPSCFLFECFPIQSPVSLVQKLNIKYGTQRKGGEK